ncbi:ATP-binding protein [Corynebacterium cystitidis]|uniref:Phage shock protein C (PspC) family protein n=1 Tax=Corynebacterium cystitidis DSM 20524 TaxID=1121357 RepID=A0A1H9QXC3_9CORY|nr:ATP-binding protein [Corynebacterium cystitidis]WJY81626.1 nitrate/nitrite sensor protein NarQ [Corynebacterium cystitidis DSM 20524]SER65106.1 phage shock protein C (PspC) family protein [Corynebacterium cystitidis DSM 20524]SNV85560.1 two component sensor kinase [Corynebacterium cystitidis]
MSNRTPYVAIEPIMVYPRYSRPKNGRVVAGVAAGLAQHLGVDVSWVRVGFAVAAFASGMGAWAYALVWMFSKQNERNDDIPGNGRRPSTTNWVLVALGVFGAFITPSLLNGVSGVVLVALGIVAVGAVLAWQSFDSGHRSIGNMIALIAGVVLVFLGVLAMALLWEDGGFVGAVASVSITLLGVGILVVPLVMRLTNSLVEAREQEAVANQRTEIASRLHDSVLQTLALIQKQADNPDEVARLARGQERELRAWLFDAEEKQASTVFAALNKAAGEVEDLVGMRIGVVTVGEDVDFTTATEPLVLAAREAMVNAGKHAGVDELNVYAENLAGELSVFVRDRGPGFDPDEIPADRHGVRDSIIGRMERAGGRSSIRSSETGTEIMVSLPVMS